MNHNGNLAFALEGLAMRLRDLLERLGSPYDFTWTDVFIMQEVKKAGGEFPLTRLLYPASGDRERAQELFQRLKDADFVEVKHSEDGPVMIDLTQNGEDFVERTTRGYQQLHARIADAVSQSFAADLAAVDQALRGETDE